MMEGKGESKRGNIEKRAVPEKSRSRGALKSDDDGEATEMPQASNSPPGDAWPRYYKVIDSYIRTYFHVYIKTFHNSYLC
jgi:hypothetical protein